MRSSKEILRNFGMAATLTCALGASACSNGHNHESKSTSPITSAMASPNCLTLDSFNLVGASKSDGEKAVNKGDCAAMYDVTSLKKVGEIASGAAFIIDCEAVEPMRFKTEVRLEVEAGGLKGYTALDGAALKQFNANEFTSIPNC
ncbi:MAG TPA: hypothetical protein VLG16_00785 [Candidatus Saccharimonadales bacterium]|nr:hypothetical protein [Candidatus Saccharimonadales bacterium]